MGSARRVVAWRFPFARFWPSIVLALYVLVAFGRFLPANYASSDWWPVLATDHLATLADIPRLFTEPNAAGDPEYIRETALDYRPIGTASYGIDYRLWGFDHPWGYQLTNLLIHMTVVFATYAFGRKLGLSRWASVLAALVFTSHPAIVATEPGIGRRLDTLSAAFALGSVLLLLRDGIWRLALAAVLFGISVLSKEISLVIVPLAAGILLIRRDPIYRIAWLGPPVVVALGLRLAVLGGIGGYGTAAVPSLARLADYREAMVHLLAYFAAPGPEIGTYTEMSARLAALVLLVIVAAWLCPIQQRSVALFGLAWFLVYVETYSLLRVYNGWYLYQPMIGIGLLIGALADGAVACWPSGRAVPALALAISAAAVALHSSTLMTPYPEWLDVGDQVSAYLAAVDQCIEDGNPPLFARRKGPYSDVVAATGLAEYSVKAYVELRYSNSGRPCDRLKASSAQP